MKRINTAKWLEKQKRWQIKVQKDGVRRTFTSSIPGRKGQEEANQKADDWLDDGLINQSLRAQKAFDKWLEQLKLTTSKSHWRPYKSYWDNHISVAIANLKVGSIREPHLQKVINKAYSNGLSKKTLSNIRACMVAFIKFCRINQATTLVVENIKIPNGAKRGEREILQPRDLKLLFESDSVVKRGKAEFEHFIYAYRFAVLTGLRPGEVIGLKKDDIKGTVVNLKRSINQDGETTTGKNRNAQRQFVLTPLAKAVLDEQRAYLKKANLHQSDFMFPNKDGESANPRTYYERWIFFRDQVGISKVTPYELRHTFVSIIKGLPEGYIKPLVGHSVDMDTYKTYSHEIDGEKELTASLVQEQFLRVLDV